MSTDKSDLGNRMKSQYEDRTRYFLPRRTYTVIRCDGKAFHTYTRKFAKPFDGVIETGMFEAAKALFDEAQGANFAYSQSDEISVLLTDFARPETAAWFDGNVQKICSVSASVVTMAFNKIIREANSGFPTTALFDARVFVIPDPVEVENYFVWRQKDAERNSLSMLAQYHFSHKQLQGKSCAEMHEMLHSKGVNWNDLETRCKRGWAIYNNTIDTEIPVFTKERKFLTDKVPRQWADNNIPDVMEDLVYFQKKMMSAFSKECCVAKCTKSPKWVRKTQFAGNHAFCEDCAKKEPDFGKGNPSCIWQQFS